MHSIYQFVLPTPNDPNPAVTGWAIARSPNAIPGDADGVTGHFPQHSILIGANGSVRGKKVSGLACWPPSPSGEPSLTVSMEDYWSLLGWGLP